jgi:hypothetical protein
MRFLTRYVTSITYILWERRLMARLRDMGARPKPTPTMNSYEVSVRLSIPRTRGKKGEGTAQLEYIFTSALTSIPSTSLRLDSISIIEGDAATNTEGVSQRVPSNLTFAPSSSSRRTNPTRPPMISRACRCFHCTGVGSERRGAQTLVIWQ